MKALPYKTVLITGASSGIGASFARFLSARGMRVLLNARRAERLAEIRDKIIQAGGQAEIYPADLSIGREREVLSQNILAKYPVDVLINNAGFGWYGYYQQMPWDVAQRMMATNTEAAAHLTHLFLPGMMEARRGHIIHIGSIAGIFPNQGVVMYSATKSFLHGFNTALHRELHGSGVHSSVMNLGPVRTEFFEQARRIEGGRRVPAEKLAVSVEKVNHALWRLMHWPKRAVYVPGWLYFANYVDLFFGGIVDLAGPALLRGRKN